MVALRVRILLAFDKFKGTLSAAAVSEAVARGLRRGGVDAAIEICPIADGGEGFTEAVVTALGGSWRETRVPDARGREIGARYGWIEEGGKPGAVMEMSAASGLALVRDLPLDPRVASTRGTGELMRAARDAGAERILIGIGGSATNDGGCGMAAALGYRFLDAAGVPVVDLPAEWERVERIEGGWDFAGEVVVASDVNNPLLGPEGATRVYGAQKGVEDFGFFEARLERLADLVRRDLGCDFRALPGAGAAGGLGFGLMSFCRARLQAGFDLVAEISRLRERIGRADLILTGEGKLDGQTLHGKGPMGVAGMARALGRPVVAIAGIIERNPVLQASFARCIEVKPPEISIAEAMARAPQLLEDCVARNAGAIIESAHHS